VLEAVTPARLAEAVDRLIYARKGSELRRQAAPGSEALFDRGRCKGHFEGHRARIESAVAESLERLVAMA
jgi:hypothetical protein